MSEEERTHVQLIESIIGRKMKPLYWIHGGTAFVILGLFLTISMPISSKVISLSEDVKTIQNKKIDQDESYRNFLTKGAYFILSKDEHEADLSAIRNPKDADLIYMKLNSSQSERLELTTRSSK